MSKQTNKQTNNKAVINITLYPTLTLTLILTSLPMGIPMPCTPRSPIPKQNITGCCRMCGCGKYVDVGCAGVGPKINIPGFHNYYIIYYMASNKPWTREPSVTTIMCTSLMGQLWVWVNIHGIIIMEKKIMQLVNMAWGLEMHCQTNNWMMQEANYYQR